MVCNARRPGRHNCVHSLVGDSFGSIAAALWIYLTRHWCTKISKCGYSRSRSGRLWSGFRNVAGLAKLYISTSLRTSYHKRCKYTAYLEYLMISHSISVRRFFVELQILISSVQQYDKPRCIEGHGQNSAFVQRARSHARNNVPDCLKPCMQWTTTAPGSFIGFFGFSEDK